MKNAVTLVAAAMVALIGAVAGFVGDLQRAADAPPAATRPAEPARRFTVELAGRQIVIVVGTPTTPTPSPTPTPIPDRNLSPPSP